MKTIKLLFCIALLTFSHIRSYGQIISTFAGNHHYGYSGDGGAASGAELKQPAGIAISPSGDIYISDGLNNRIRKVDKNTGIITTVVGTGMGLYNGDGGPATAACIQNAYGITFDASGNLYIADASNDVIRKVNTSGIISTVVGTGSIGYSGDGGVALNAQMHSPVSLSFDASGNMYIVDFINHVIRKVNTLGIITTVSGNGYNHGLPNGGYSGDGGPAVNAELNEPEGVAIDSHGNIFIADSYNSVIRMVNTAGIISTVVGYYPGRTGYSGDGGPATAAELYGPCSVCFDNSGNLYIGDFMNNVIRIVNTTGIISTAAGIGYGYSGDGGPATAAELGNPWVGAFDVNGNLYIADEDNNVIRMISNIETGLSQQKYKSDLVTLFPNPSNGTFSIQTVGAQNFVPLTIEIYNVLGEKVYSKSVIRNSQFVINLNQPNGIYLYRVVAEDGSLIGEGKVIIEK